MKGTCVKLIPHDKKFKNFKKKLRSYAQGVKKLNRKEITYLRSTIFVDQYNNREQSKYIKKPMAKIKTKRVPKNGKRRGFFH